MLCCLQFCLIIEVSSISEVPIVEKVNNSKFSIFGQRQTASALCLYKRPKNHLFLTVRILGIQNGGAVFTPKKTSVLCLH